MAQRRRLPCRHVRCARRRQLELLEPRMALAADVVINEFVASNQGGYADGFGKSPDWIELWNRGDAPINLQGFALTDDPAQPTQWVFPSFELDADGYAVVFASGADETTVDPAGNLHANFRLARTGDLIQLRDPQGLLVSNVGAPENLYPEQLVNVSYGLGQPNGTIGYLDEPSPGEPNGSDDDVRIDFVRDTKFTVDRGYFTESFEVAITTATEDAVIHYTLDGTAPALGSGLIYNGPITVSDTTVLRAMATRDGYVPTNVDTQTYFFLEDVLTQDGTGLPDTWGTFVFGSTEAPRGSAVPANYDIDPEVVNDPRYRETFIDDLRSLPTLSLVLRPDDLWDEASGIYANPLESGVAWERGGSIELISPTGDTEFQIDAGIRIHGGFGRRPAATAKHSFRLFFKGEYGASKLDYPWFGEDQVSEFDTIVLRAHYNYSWARGNRGGDQTGADYTMLNDRWANLAQQEMGGLAPNGDYVHLYVNGKYWGVYNPTERPDASFQAAHRGDDELAYDVQNHEGLVDGDPAAWRDLRNIVRRNPLDYDAVKNVLNVDNFIDYMILNQFGGNGDWPRNNWYASRLRADGAQWEFHVWDSEFYFVDPNSDRIQTIENAGPGEIYRQLLESDEFKLRFADRIQRHLFNGGTLTLERNIERLDEIAEVIDRAMVPESARWGDAWMNQVDPARTRDDDWLPRLQQLRAEYFPARHDTVIRQYERRGLFPDTRAPRLSPFGGLVELGSTALLENPNASGMIYFTLDGTDPRAPDGSLAETAQVWPGGDLSLDASAMLRARVRTDDEWSPLIEAEFRARLPGDTNSDSVVDVRDLDYLCQLISADEFDPLADVNGDGQLNLEDRDPLLGLLDVPIGDANFDGVFDSSDLVAIFTSGHYEDDELGNSSWSTGDWNCDGEFDSSDLVAAFVAGTYVV